MRLNTTTTTAAIFAAHSLAVEISSPGLLGGNVVQSSVHIPINVCGNSVNVIGLLNPTFENTCINKKARRGSQKPIGVFAYITSEAKIALDAPEGTHFDLCGSVFGPGKVEHVEEIECEEGEQVFIW